MTDHTATAVLSPGVDPGSRWQLRYWAVFGGQASSLVGSALTQFVLMWWITDTTGSVAALALAGVFALLPHALLGPLGGTFADRSSRRALMIMADLVSALCMSVLIVLFLTNSVELWHLYTMMFIRSAMQAFQAPAAAASTAMLVPTSFLTRAAGLNQMMAAMMLIGAAPLGALAISLMPIGYALAIDVVTALLGIVPLLVFRIPQPKIEKADRQGVWTELREGFVTVWSHPGLRRLYGLMAAVTIVIMPAMTLAPLLVKEHFRGGAPEVALMESMAGLGMLLGGGIAALLVPRRKMLWILGSMAASCFTFSLMSLAPSDMLWLGTFWWALSSLLYVLGSAPFTALLQTIVPNRLQGRVLSLLTTVIALGGPVGIAIATPLGEAIGIVWLFVLMGILGGLVTLVGFLSPHLRNIENTIVAAKPGT
ncbi:MFS transporter [Devosia sediminis]|uniref:MFS transporter n=1 Tax=Devosia sediminis TaxID=2798801 RepID=A0A934J0X9_9HYPH|nr:MFS transporter [Devosia sediminis]MBJ3785765.1 MFS transporter [Devosia sediminis]